MLSRGSLEEVSFGTSYVHYYSMTSDRVVTLCHRIKCIMMEGAHEESTCMIPNIPTGVLQVLSLAEQAEV